MAIIVTTFLAKTWAAAGASCQILNISSIYTDYQNGNSPNEPTLNYHNLDQRCQNGGNAMTLFPLIEHMPPEEAAASREALLRYCELDTWAMVKVWEKLKEVAKEESANKNNNTNIQYNYGK